MPMSKDEMRSRGWDELDIVLITGDAYVDHPSYGVAVIGRVLEREGYKVGIIAQPAWKNAEDFKKLGRPRLFFGVTSGNVDSMVANYTASKKPRKLDDYSPGGSSGKRPDRAVIVYTNRVKEAFPGVPVVLGGIEASLRRFAHYDYWSDGVRRSILLDAKADMLVYGMGEKPVVELAGRVYSGENIKDIKDIRGTVVAGGVEDIFDEKVILPSFEEAAADKKKFNLAVKLIHDNIDPYKPKAIAQAHGGRMVIQLPPQLPMTPRELDGVYDLEYVRSAHPSYAEQGGVKSIDTVKFSINSHRGCAGQCNFCSLYFHQGRIVQSRSEASILKEAGEIAALSDFKGTVTDVGGPTANLYAARCRLWEKSGYCRDRNCLVPEKCKNLELGYKESLELYRKISEIPGVKHVFIGSGFRFDLLADGYAEKYLGEVCSKYISGQMKVAPEYCVDGVLSAMNKAPFRVYKRFLEQFAKVNRGNKDKVYLANYFISAHPGAGIGEAVECGLYLASKGMSPEQVQDFIPLPMTISGAMYHTGFNPMTGEKVYAAKDDKERKIHRAFMQYRSPENGKIVKETLIQAGKQELLKKFM